MKYGDLPEVVATDFDLPTDEMLCWLYCPVSTPGFDGWALPANLAQFGPLLDAVWKRDEVRFVQEYVYLTAKTLYVTPSNPGNRPGWHSDGFGTNDINYIWYDRAPTQFLSDEPFDLPDDCAAAMQTMERYATADKIIVFPPRWLLRLTPSCIHRSPVSFEPGMRTFLKVSISPDRYNLLGNSRNHSLPGTDWPLYPRQTERNHTSCTDKLTVAVP